MGHYSRWFCVDDVHYIEYDGPLMLVLGLLQVSGGVDWRKKLDSQRGAAFATELKNNSFKMAKWALSAILAGSSFIKFG